MDEDNQIDKNLKAGLTGLLLGAGGAGAIQAVRELMRLHKERKKNDPVLEAMLLSDKEDKAGESGDDLEKRSSEDGVSSAGRLIGNAFGGAAGAFNDLTNTAGKAWLDTATKYGIAAGALGAGAYGVNEIFDKLKKQRAKERVEDIKEYYYSNLVGGNYDAEIYREETNRENNGEPEDGGMEKKSFNLSEAMLMGLIPGVPLATAYFTKKYMDNTLPKIKQPVAGDNDPRSRVMRVSKVNELPGEKEGDEDKKEEESGFPKTREDVINMFRGVGKSASLNPSDETAFECSQIFKTAAAHPDSDQSVLHDLVRTVENEGVDGIKKAAASGGVEKIVDYATEKSGAYAENPSTERSRYLAIDLLSSDPETRGYIHPIASGEYLERYPTSVKMASAFDEGDAEVFVTLLKSAVAEYEQRLFPGNEDRDFRKQASPGLHWREHVNRVFKSGGTEKSASSDDVYAAQREWLFGE